MYIVSAAANDVGNAMAHKHYQKLPKATTDTRTAPILFPSLEPSQDRTAGAAAENTAPRIRPGI